MVAELVDPYILVHEKKAIFAAGWSIFGVLSTPRARSSMCWSRLQFLSKLDTVKDMEKHVAIIIPGLGIERLQLLTSHWRIYHVEPVHHRVGWHSGEHFEASLGKILARIDSFSNTGTKVSLIGCSASGSADLNAFLERKNTVHKIISLCGWLRVGEHRKYLERLKRISASFVESVTILDRRENDLSSEDRAKIMTVRPIFDELVASDVVILDRAQNITLPVPGHTLAIVFGLTIFSRQLIDFIRASA